jgi:hypothetical protein
MRGRRGGSFTDKIPYSPCGVKQLPVEVVVDFFAEFADVDVDEVGTRVEVVFPDFLEEHGARADGALVAHEGFEEFEFAGAEVDLSAAARGDAGSDVEGKVADAEEDGAGFAASAGEGLEAGDDFAHGEGFGDVIVGTCVEAFDALIDFAAGGEEEDGGTVAALAEGSDGGEAVDAWEHDVHDDGVEGAGADEFDGVIAAVGDGDSIAAFGEAEFEGLSGAGFIFDDEDFHEVSGDGGTRQGN